MTTSVSLINRVKQSINIHFYLLAAKKYYQRRGVVLDIDEVPVVTTEKFEEVDIFSSEEDDDDWEWEKWQKCYIL